MKVLILLSIITLSLLLSSCGTTVNYSNDNVYKVIDRITGKEYYPVSDVFYGAGYGGVIVTFTYDGKNIRLINNWGLETISGGE